MANDNRSSLEVFKQVVRHGITLVSIDYRLNSEAAYPAQIYDVLNTPVRIRCCRLLRPYRFIDDGS